MFVLYLVLAMVLAGSLGLLAFYHRKALKMTSTARGRVIGVEERVVRDRHGRREQTLVRCAFDVKGRGFVVEQVLRGRQAARFPPDCELPVRYNPYDPNMSRIAIE